MVNAFERHKKKGLLAALFLLFHGRNKYATIILMVAVASAPFLVSGELLGKVASKRPVVMAMQALGLGNVIYSLNPEYEDEALKDGPVKPASGANDAFWQKFLNRASATLPPGGGASSLAMVTAGNVDELFGAPRVRDGAKARPGQVKGAVNEAERRGGEDGDTVDLNWIPPGEDSEYAGAMQQKLAGKFAAGAYSSGRGAQLPGQAPYLGKQGGKGKGASSTDNVSVYSGALSRAVRQVPVPSSPLRVNAQALGRASGFSWSNVGYRLRQSGPIPKLGSTKPMFQLARAHTLGHAAYVTERAAYETQATYVGSTYDGSDAKGLVMETEYDPPSMPVNSSFVGAVMGKTEELQERAAGCAVAQGEHGASMSVLGKRIDELGKTLKDPPMCCNRPAVKKWNQKVDELIEACVKFNDAEMKLAAACMTDQRLLDCQGYAKLRIKPCSILKCALGWIIVAILALVTLLTFGLTAGLLVLALGALAMLLFGGRVAKGGGEMDVDASEQERKANFESKDE